MFQKRVFKSIVVLLIASFIATSTLTGCSKKPTSVVSSSASVSDTSSLDTSTSTGSSAISSTTQISNSSRPVASNAISAPPKKEEVSMHVETILSIKPVRDHFLKEKATNMGGATFKFATFWPEKYKTSSYPNSAYYVNQLNSIKKDYNCKIEIVPLAVATYAKDINTAKAAGKVYANIFDTQLQFSNLISGGILADLRTVNAVNLAGNDWNDAFTLTATYQNGIYGVGVDQNKIHRQGIFFNKTIAAKYNLGNFYDMVKKRQWTFDKFLSISQDVYNKSNKQVYGMTSHTNYWMGNFVYADGGSPVIIKNGKVVFNDQDSKVINSLNFIQNYSKLNLIDKALYAKNVNENGTLSQLTAFTTSKSLFHMCSDDIVVYINTMMNDDFGFLPLPLGPTKKDYISLLSDANYFGLYDKDPNIEKSGTIMVAIANRLQIKIADWDKAAATSFRDQDSLDMSHLLMNCDPVIIAGGDFLKGGLVDYNEIAIPSIVALKQTPRQALDAIAKSVTVQINRYYGN